MSISIADCEIVIPTYQLIYLIALVISLFNWKRTQERIIWSSFLFVCVFIEIVLNEYLACFYSTNTMSINFYVVIVCAFYISFFNQSLDDILGISISWLPITFFFLSLIYLIFKDLSVIQLVPYIIGLLISTVLIGFYLFQLILETEHFSQLFQAPRFWLGTGIVIFTSVNFPYFFHLQEIFNSPSIWEPLYGVVQKSNIGLSLSYLICSICLMRSKFY